MSLRRLVFLVLMAALPAEANILLSFNTTGGDTFGTSFWRTDTWVMFAWSAEPRRSRNVSMRPSTRRSWSCTSRMYSCSPSGTTSK